MPSRRIERVDPATLTRTPKIGRAPQRPVTPKETPKEPTVWDLGLYGPEEEAEIRAAFARAGQKAGQAVLSLEGDQSPARVLSAIKEFREDRRELQEAVDKVVADLLRKVRERQARLKAGGESSQPVEAVTERSRTGGGTPNGQSSRSSDISPPATSQRGVEPASMRNGRRGRDTRVRTTIPSPPETPPKHRAVRRTDPNSEGTTVLERSRLETTMGYSEQGAEADVSEESESSGSEDEGYWVKDARKQKPPLSGGYEDFDYWYR